jgi:hypothetical protein
MLDLVTLGHYTLLHAVASPGFERGWQVRAAEATDLFLYVFNDITHSVEKVTSTRTPLNPHTQHWRDQAYAVLPAETVD